MKPYDLNHIPFANNYDGNEVLEWWCIGDKSKNEDIWSVVIDIKKGYAQVDMVLPVAAIEAGGYNPSAVPIAAHNEPCWIVYADYIECANTIKKTDVVWLSALQNVLDPWDETYRNPLEESISYRQ
jgi:hypothetical protein